MINEYKREATRQELIDEVERLQKENKVLKDKYMYEKVAKEEFEELLENSISKEKLKEKIKELESKLNTDNNIRLYTIRDSFELQISILQELLEEEF